MNWKRKPTIEEEAELNAFLAKQPEVQADWEDEKMVAELLRQLPDTHVPSNFTMQVLLAVKRRDSTKVPSGRWSWWQWLGSLRPAQGPAIAGLVVCLSFFSYHQYPLCRKEQTSQERRHHIQSRGIAQCRTLAGL